MTTLGRDLRHAAEWVAGLTPADLPADVRALAIAQRVNILAAAAAGSRTAVGRRVIAAVDRMEAEGDVRTVPDGRRRTLMGAAFVGAACATALELDDFVFAGHTGQAAVIVPLTLGQVTGSDGEEALLAQVAANEVAGRLGAVMTAGPQHGHMKAYMSRAAAATAAARLLGLGAEATTRALAIALSGPEFPLFPASWSADTKVLCTADPIIAGMRAALLAAEGLDPAVDVVEHPAGLITALSHHETAPSVWDRLGVTWSLQAICFKPLCACAYACAAAEAAATIADAEGTAWDPERVLSVQVATTLLSLTLEGLSRPHRPGLLTPVNTNFSTRRSVALTLLAGRPAGPHFVPATFGAMRENLAGLADRVALRHDWPMTIQLLRGVDGAIDHPGRPGIYGMVEGHRTFDRFAAKFGTPPVLGIRDMPALLGAGPRDLGYLLRRYAVGWRSRLPFRNGAAGRRAYRARETDLRRMAIRFGAGVQVRMRDGRTLSHTVSIPTGFAGDPDRLAVPDAKFLREVGATASPAQAQRILALLHREPLASPVELAANPLVTVEAIDTDRTLEVPHDGPD